MAVLTQLPSPELDALLGRGLRAAGAVVVTRDGHQVIAHYGSAAAELTVCVKRAGLVHRPDLGVLELRAAEPWLDHVLSRGLGDRVPGAGRAVGVAGTWCCRLAEDRAVVAGPHAALARWRRVTRGAIIGGSPLRCADLDGAAQATLVGPRAARVLEAAGLPGGLPVGGVGAGDLAGAPAFVVREGAQRFLLAAETAAPGDPWAPLFAAGRPLGLSLAGSDALDRLTAAARLHA